MLDKLRELEKVEKGIRWTVQRTSITGYSLLVRGEDGSLTASTQLPTGVCEHIAAFHNAAPALLAVAETADRWRKRKGHGDDHDCDLCNSLRALKDLKP